MPTGVRIPLGTPAIAMRSLSAEAHRAKADRPREPARSGALACHTPFPSHDISVPMSTLTEIENAAEALSPEEKQQLLLFLATRLRGQNVRLPEPRKFSKEQMDAWIAEDEADMRRLRESR